MARSDFTQEIGPAARSQVITALGALAALPAFP